MESNIINFIIRKIFMSLYLLYRFYDSVKIIRNKKVNDISLNKLFQFIVFMFLVFSNTYQFNYDLIDKIMIFITFPIIFLIESVLFFKNKADLIKKEKISYVAILAFFIITELLYIFKNEIFF